jgi:hypothetical protein
MNVVIVQQLSVVWTKKSRGTPAAAVRNALPQALPVISHDAAYIYQRHAFSEAAGYSHRLVEDQTANQVPRSCRDLGLTLEDGVLNVQLSWTAQMGQPPRKSSGVAKLTSNQWARFFANGRHTDAEGSQCYRREIYNIALVPAATDDVFTRTAPTTVARLEADLF